MIKEATQATRAPHRRGEDQIQGVITGAAAPPEGGQCGVVDDVAATGDGEEVVGVGSEADLERGVAVEIVGIAGCDLTFVVVAVQQDVLAVGGVDAVEGNGGIETFIAAEGISTGDINGEDACGITCGAGEEELVEVNVGGTDFNVVA